MLQILLCCLLGYLIGTVNPAAYLSKRKQHNLTESGTGNLGATNAMLAFGLRYGILVFVLDLFKAFLSVHISKFLFKDVPLGGLIAGCCTVVGHIFPFHLRFKGGKGSACFAGVVLAFQPLLFPVLLLISVTLGLVIDYAFLVPVSAVILFPFLAAFRTGSLAVLCITLAMGALIIVQHKQNFIALKAGTEGRFRTWFAEKLRSR